MTKNKSTKRALLMSALSMLLCVSMLIGSTFAWFTDSVTSGNNIIKSGNLDIELEYWNGTAWTDVKGASNIFTNTLWEPGVTEVAYLRVANAGSLALKYQLGINIRNEIAGKNQANETFKLSDYIMFGVVENVNGKTDAYTKDDAGRAAAIADVTDAKKISSGYTKADSMESGDELYLALVVYMPTNVGNIANHNGTDVPQIDLGINVYATQKDAESDSFGSDYDERASVTVAPGESLAAAINNVEDGGIVFLENGVHNVASGPIVIEGKTVTIIGLGEVTINKNYGGTHIFTVKNGADVTIANVTMDGKGNTREGIYVRWNSKVTLEDVVIKNTDGKDIMIDEASDVINGYITESTASYVWLYSSSVEDVAICAAPTQDGHINTYVYFNYDADTTIGSIEKQDINLKPENIYINGVNVEDNGMNLYVSNDAELAAALETIKNDSKYHNVQVYVHLTAGEYSANHVINQYPKWNGTVGRNNGNNYQGGVTAGDPSTAITFVGETASTYSLRGTQTEPVVIFTGNVTVNGFGDAQAGFATAVARTTFENIAFSNSTKANADGNIAAVEMTAAAANVTFNQCTFQKAEYVIVGARAYNIVGDITFDGCTFSDVCVSGYVDKTITVKNSVVLDADDGFINNQNSGDIVVDNCTINAGRYFVRTNGSGIEITVKNSDITVYESEDTKHLVFFRGSNESAEFIDCNITAGYTTEGVDANSTLEIINWYVEDGVEYYKDGVTNDVVLYFVPSTYTKSELVIPEGVTVLGNGAIGQYASQSVKKVVCPSTLLTMGTSFAKNTYIEEVVLNEGLTEIPEKAFNQATSLKSVNIPSTVTKIGLNAFRAIAVEELTIPATVKELAEGAFRDMPYVKTITIEGNPVIGNFAFRECHVLETVNLNGFDVTFASGTSIVFSNKQSGESNGLVINVPTEEMKTRVKSANSSGTNYTVNVTTDWEIIENASGVYTRNEGKEYGVANSQGLAWLEQQTDNYFAGKTVKLVSDIDCGGQTVQAIKFWSPENKTAFDGQGYTIANFTIENTSGNAGLFNGTLDIKNLDVADADVTGTYAGLLAGNMYGNIENCHVKNAEVSTTYWQAGILVGQYNSGNIINCTVEDCVVKGASSVGVLVGILNETAGVRKVENCTIRNCQVVQEGSFGSDYDTLFGIITGYVNVKNSEVYFTNCTIEGNTVRGVASDLLYGEKQDSTTVIVN